MRTLSNQQDRRRLNNRDYGSWVGAAAARGLAILGFQRIFRRIQQDSSLSGVVVDVNIYVLQCLSRR
jgi:hypothetical protein